LRLGAAIAGGHQGDFVDGGFFGQGEGDAGGQGLEHGGTAVLAFQALVAFHTTVGGITGFALFKRELDAVDAASGVDQLEVVDVAVGEGHAVGRISACPVYQGREKLLFGLSLSQGRRQGADQAGCRNRCGESELT